ncbi:hypothetical protein [Streptomyces sp. NPDC048603]|uniref:hypothetical protein n=1 Tax=Streptomyces sp. NPDC048603 TaxID=3365577 RepID=UPI003710AA1B
MCRRLPLFVLAPVALLAAGAALVVAAPFGTSGQPVTMKQLMSVLPRGKDVPGYRAVFQRPETGIGPSPEHHCGRVESALWSPDRMPVASTRVVLSSTRGGQERHVVDSYSYAEDDAEVIMDELRASIPACAHYNSYFADLYLRFGTKPAEPPFAVGDEMVGYRVLAPPEGHVDLAGSGVPLGPGPLREPGASTTFVRTGGVITRYRLPVPQDIPEGFHERFRRAPDAED